MTFWPGTKIIKSRGNAFDWRNQESQLAKDYAFNRQSTAPTQQGRSFTIYSKAQRSK